MSFGWRNIVPGVLPGGTVEPALLFTSSFAPLIAGPGPPLTGPQEVVANVLNVVRGGLLGFGAGYALWRYLPWYYATPASALGMPLVADYVIAPTLGPVAADVFQVAGAVAGWVGWAERSAAPPSADGMPYVGSDPLTSMFVGYYGGAKWLFKKLLFGK